MAGKLIVNPDGQAWKPDANPVREPDLDLMAMTRSLLEKLRGMLIGSRIDHPILPGIGLQRVDHLSLPGVSQMPVPNHVHLAGVYRMTGDPQGRTVEVFLFLDDSGRVSLDMRSDPAMPPDMRAQMLTCLFPMPMAQARAS